MWDERYSSSTYVYGTEPNRFLAENTQRLQKGKILCLAEGEGRNAVHLARCGYEVISPVRCGPSGGRSLACTASRTKIMGYALKRGAISEP